MKYLLFSTPLLRVLEILLHQREELSDQEITKKVYGVKRAAVHQVLTKLSDLHIIERSRRGRQCYNILNWYHPWVVPLKIVSNFLALDPLMAKLRPHATKIILFGSRAQGTNDEASDFDLFVISSQKAEIMRIVDQDHLNSQIQLVMKDEGEALELEEKEPFFFKNIRKGTVLWEA